MANESQDGFRIDILDDDPGHRTVIRDALEEAESSHLRICEHPDLRSLLDAIKTNRDETVILVDYQLGSDNATDVIPTITAEKVGPVIVLTGQGDEEIAARCMRLGASDYIVKSRALREPLSLRHAIQAARERYRLARQNATFAAELKAKNARLAELYDMSQAFVDNVSHEFRTPLAVLKEFSALLLEGIAGDLGDTQREYIQIMASKVDELAIMVNDLLDSSRIESGLLGMARRPCEIADILDAVRLPLERFAENHRVRLSLNCPAELPQVYGDPEKLGRIVINLAVNAIKFSPEDGSVDVTAERDASDCELVRLSVTDHGPGIPSDDLEAIFERFKQFGSCRAATKGFGLGLSIVRDLVALNLCDIQVQSEIERGTTFNVLVPTYGRDRLVRRYLDRLSDLGVTVPIISLLVLDVAHEDQARRIEAADVISRSIRPSNLLLQVRSGTRWLLLCASPDSQKVIGSLRKAVTEEYRGMPEDAVPVVSLEAIGTWDAATDGEVILNRCCQVYAAAEEDSVEDRHCHAHRG